MSDEFFAQLRCPLTGEALERVERADFAARGVPAELGPFTEIEAGTIGTSGRYFYPIFREVYLLHQQYAIFLERGEDVRSQLSFDKQRVLDYYNEIEYLVKEDKTIYEDSGKWVDYRPVAIDYLRASFRRAGEHLPERGDYLLDIASGPIGSVEYLDLSKNFTYRVCGDISLRALLQAKANLEAAGQQGIYLCADLTNIPLAAGSCDAVLSQHTLYHLPKNDQAKAVEEMYRVTRTGGRTVIVYGWFYHSWGMNLSLHFVQLYRVARHFAGKAYVRLRQSKPRLYYYSHSPTWFRRRFSFSDRMEFHCWRSTNKYFLRMYVHPRLGGKGLLRRIGKWERKYSKFLATFGEYAAIVIEKV